jgi:hypothetical protein
MKNDVPKMGAGTPSEWKPGRPAGRRRPSEGRRRRGCPRFFASGAGASAGAPAATASAAAAAAAAASAAAAGGRPGPRRQAAGLQVCRVTVGKFKFCQSRC